MIEDLKEQRRVHIHTFGCQMNELDSDKMYALLAHEGYEKVETPDTADLVLVNTCSIREKAEHKLYSLLGRFRERPEVILGVTGCVAQQEGKTLLKKFPYVDLVMGPDAIPRVNSLVARARSERVLDVDIFEGLEYPFVSDLPQDIGRRTSAFVTIQKGCDNKCTFCIVPATRGIERSRPADDIVLEIRALTYQGVREITLLGQNVNSYGKKVSGGISFAQLLKRIDSEADELRRIRFTTSHPRDFGPDLIEAYATLPRLSPYLHLPVQSGSNPVLKRMKRYYTVEKYLEQIDALKAAVPGMTISTDFIVGFPGETEEDFEATLRLLERVRFDSSFSFMYSPRPNTPALKLVDDVPLEDKKRRLYVLQELQKRISIEQNAALVGTNTRVLVEGTSRHNPAELTGRSPGNKMVNFPGHPRLIGQEVPVKVMSAHVNSLRGDLVLQ